MWRTVHPVRSRVRVTIASCSRSASALNHAASRILRASPLAREVLLDDLGDDPVLPLELCPQVGDLAILRIRRRGFPASALRVAAFASRFQW